MKSAYELAMERLNKTAPSTKLSTKQKAALADLDSRYKAKIAERELAIKDDITKAQGARDADKIAELQQQLVVDRKKLQADLEDKKEAVRRGKS